MLIRGLNRSMRRNNSSNVILLWQQAVAAICLYNGTLLLPGAATPVLGGELVTNGDFSAGTTTGWTGSSATLSVVDGKLNVQTTAGTAGYAWQQLTTVVGKQYLCVVGVSTVSGSLAAISVGTSSSAVNLFTQVDIGAGSFTFTFTATTTTSFMLLQPWTNMFGRTTQFDNISVKEITAYTHGNPALRNYLDSAGTDILDSVTQFDQPVGLCLDSMRQVGPNVFSDAAVSFSGESTRVSPGVYRIYSSAGVFSKVTVANGAWVNKTYMLRFYQDTAVAGALAVDGPAGSVVGAFPAGIGWKECIVTMTASASISIKRSSGVTDIQISSVTIEEIPGNHASQPTTASKPILRRGLVNQLTQSDFQNGVTDAPVRAGPVTASTLAGYDGALAIGYDGAITAYALKNYAHAAGLAYTFAVVVKMDDGGLPVFASGDSMSPLNTFAMVGCGNLIDPTTLVVQLLSGGACLVMGALVASGVNQQFGVYKYSANNNRTFKVTRYGLFQGTVTAQQILAAGGVPLTSAVPASSATGRWQWAFDANDTLGLTLPAGFNAATTIDARSTGHVTLQNQNIVGAYSIGPSITSFGRIIIPGTPSAADLALMQRYANWLAGL